MNQRSTPATVAERVAYLEPMVACDERSVTFYANGHRDKRKFRGAMLSASDRLSDDSWVDIQKPEILRVSIHHGYMVQVSETDGEWCEPGWVTRFGDDPSEGEDPQPVTFATFSDTEDMAGA
jgi:hypothetical protein